MNNRTLVTCYTNPDIDGLACVLSYVEFLQKTGHANVFPGIFGSIQGEPRFVLDYGHITLPINQIDVKRFDKIVLVDSSEINGIESSIDPTKVVEIIDHRKINDTHQFPHAKLQIDLVGSAATLIAEKFKEQNLPVSSPSALLLLAAIVSNTLNFQASVTTDRDKAMYDWLSRDHPLSPTFIHEMFTTKSDLAGPKLQQQMQSDFAWFNIGGKRESIVQLEMIGAQSLVKKRKPEILQELDRWKREMSLDIIFLSIIDLEERINIFVASDSYSQKLLERIFTITFHHHVAIRPGLIMRKEITPLIKQALEQKI